MEIQPNEHFGEVKSVVFKRTVEALLLSIEEKAEKKPENAFAEVASDILALSDLLGEVVERALDLIDYTEIKLYRSSHSSREIFEVQGSNGSVYRLFPNVPLCNCRSFYRQVIKAEEFCCKHYIATRIARALGRVEVVEKSLFEFRAILKNIQF